MNKSFKWGSSLYLYTPDALHQSHHSEPHLGQSIKKLQTPLRVSVTVAERAYWQLPCAAERFRGVAILGLGYLRRLPCWQVSLSPLCSPLSSFGWAGRLTPAWGLGVPSTGLLTGHGSWPAAHWGQRTEKGGNWSSAYLWDAYGALTVKCFKVFVQGMCQSSPCISRFNHCRRGVATLYLLIHMFPFGPDCLPIKNNGSFIRQSAITTVILINLS